MEKKYNIYKNSIKSLIIISTFLSSLYLTFPSFANPNPVTPDFDLALEMFAQKDESALNVTFPFTVENLGPDGSPTSTLNLRISPSANFTITKENTQLKCTGKFENEFMVCEIPALEAHNVLTGVISARVITPTSNVSFRGGIFCDRSESNKPNNFADYFLKLFDLNYLPLTSR